MLRSMGEQSTLLWGSSRLLYHSSYARLLGPSTRTSSPLSPALALGLLPGLPATPLHLVPFVVLLHLIS